LDTSTMLQSHQCRRHSISSRGANSWREGAKMFYWFGSFCKSMRK